MYNGRKTAVFLILLLAVLGIHGSVPALGEQALSGGKPALSASKLKITSTKKTVIELKNWSGKAVWSSSDRKTAKIWVAKDTHSIRLKAMKAGSTIITAKAGSKKLTCKVRVVNKPALSHQKRTLKEGSTIRLKVTNTMSRPEWSSSNLQVASLQKVSNRTYAVTGHEPGTAVIRAKVDGKTLSCKVQVTLSDKNAVSVPAGYTGWKRKADRTWYFKDGKQVRGWQKINGKWYYFTYDGKKTNCIAGNASGGWHYVNAQGVRITDPQIRMAVEFVRSCSNDGQSGKVRLRKCFQKMCTYLYSRYPSDTPGPSAFASYAANTFTVKLANCWRYSCAMAYIARVLGFDSRVCLGGVTAHGPTHPLSAHGICEVKLDGTWKVMDVSMQRAHRNVNLFLVPRGNYPYRLQINTTHPLKIKGTAVYWE